MLTCRFPPLVAAVLAAGCATGSLDRNAPANPRVGSAEPGSLLVTPLPGSSANCAGSRESLLPSRLPRVTQEDTVSGRLRSTAVLGGVIGSGTGVALGYLIGQSLTSDCGYDDCDVGGALGYLVGGWVGGAIGAHAGARRANGTPSSGRALLGSTLGVAAGLLTSVTVGAITQSGPTGMYVALSVLVHGGVTGLFVSQARPTPGGED